MRIIAFLTDGDAIRDILTHLGEPTSPPRRMPARGPPLWDRVDAEATGLAVSPVPTIGQGALPPITFNVISDYYGPTH